MSLGYLISVSEAAVVPHSADGSNKVHASPFDPDPGVERIVS